jgi:hypothetical protein
LRWRNNGHQLHLAPFSSAECMEASVRDRIVAVGLLTQREVELLGMHFDRLWPVNEAPCFSGLLAAIDEADRDLWRQRDAISTETPTAPHTIQMRR